MSTFNKTLSLLQDLIKQSGGKPIHFGNETYCFSRQSEVTPEQLMLFEQQYNVQLPEDFKNFLLTLGACTLSRTKEVFRISSTLLNNGRAMLKRSLRVQGSIYSLISF